MWKNQNVFSLYLLVTTLQAYFEGRKELFWGLKVEALENEWEKYLWGRGIGVCHFFYTIE